MFQDKRRVTERSISPDFRKLQDTQRAFDKVAADYDGTLGNNALIQRLRKHFLSVVRQYTTAGDHLLDVGCGTGLDAVSLARAGRWITAVDWSDAMVGRTRKRAEKENLADRVFAHQMGAHEITNFPSDHFNVIYSDLGALNCIMNQDAFARQCRRVLKSEGYLVASVIGRICPWEIFYYLFRGKWKRALIRLKREPVAVNLEGEKVWTQYFTPREFIDHYEPSFEVTRLRSMNLFAPPPYLVAWYHKYPQWFARGEQLDVKSGDWPILRSMGDHFLVVLKKKD